MVWLKIFGIGAIGLLLYLVYFFFISDKGRTFVFQGIPYTSVPDNRQLEILYCSPPNSEGKFAIVYTNPSEKLGEKYETGYYYDDEDFYPRPSQVDWRNYSGVILGYRSLNGSKTCIPDMLRSLHQEIKKAKMDAAIDRTLKVQAIEERKSLHSDEERKEELFHNAGTLEAIKKLQAIEVIKNEKKSEVGINE
ncbi:MAG: hypothetical protein ACFFG0_06035 [Candidatus Thorarchaeota archaeon]